MDKKSKGIIISFFNSNNLGDILIADQLYNDYKNLDMELIKCSFEGSFNINDNLNLFKIDKNYSFIQKVYSSLMNRLERKIFHIKFKNKLKKLDVLIIGGGNMLMSLRQNDNAIKNFTFYITEAKRYNIPVLVPSIGVGPFNNKKDLVDTRQVLKMCDVVTYRDQKSYDLIVNNRNDFTNHSLSVDPVFQLPYYKNHKIKGNYNKIGIGVINTLLFDESIERYERTKSYYVKLVKKVLAKEKQVVLFSTEVADQKMIRDIEVEIKNKNFVAKYIRNIDELFSFYQNELDFLIGARMHSLIIAYTQYIPILGLSWQQKVDNLFDLIDMEENCYSLDELDLYLDIIVEKIDNIYFKESYIKKNEDKLASINKIYTLPKIAE